GRASGRGPAGRCRSLGSWGLRSSARDTGEQFRTLPLLRDKMQGLRTGVILKVRSKGDDTGETGARCGRGGRSRLPGFCGWGVTKYAEGDVVTPWFCGEAVR